jgi:hypothetical protein
MATRERVAQIREALQKQFICIMRANGTHRRGLEARMKGRVKVEKCLILQTLKKMNRRNGRMYGG